MVALLGGRRRLDRGRPVVERGVPLVVLAADEAVERLEAAAARRPGVERAHRRGLPDRHLVALAELRRRVAVQLQRHRERRLRVRPQRAVAGRRGRRLGDAAHADRVVVAAGEHRLAGSARTAPSCGTGCTSGRRPRASRRSASRTGRRTRSTRRSRRRRSGRSAHSAHPRAAAAVVIGGYGRVGVLRVVRREPRRRPIRNREHRAGVAISGHDEFPQVGRCPPSLTAAPWGRITQTA